MNKPPQPPPINAFMEGATEDGVLQVLVERKLLPKGLIESATKRTRDGSQTQDKPKGKEEMRSCLHEELRRRLPIPDRRELSLLVVQDQDQNQPAELVDGIQKLLGNHNVEARLTPIPGVEGAYQLHDSEQRLRLALVIARWDGVKEFFPDISNPSMDDYILALAMLPATAAGIVEKRQTGRPNLSADTLLAKVRTEIPALLAQNGFSAFRYAKDHIRFYAALIGESTSPVAFAKIVVKHADEADLRSHFASLLAAVAFLSPPTT